MPNNTILIIGGAGFIGNSLADGLNRPENKIIVGDTRERLERYAIPVPNVDYIEFDWQTPATYPKLTEIDTVIHLAWSSNPLSSMDNIRNDAHQNILGTIQLLESFPANSISKFIFMSSGGTVYGDSAVQPVTESVQPEPISAYGVSKLACEKYVEIYGGIKQFSPCVLRLGNPYGVYQLQGTPVGAIAKFVKNALENRPIDIRGSGEAVRDYIHVADMTTYIDKVASSNAVTGVFNISSGKGTSLNGLLQIIENISGESLKVDYSEAPESDVRSVILDCTKISNAVDYRAGISLERGIKELVDMYRSTSYIFENNTMTGEKS